MENNTRWFPTRVSMAELDNFWLSGDTALLCLQDGCYEFTIQLLNDDMSNSKLSIAKGSDCISDSAYQTLYSYYYGAPVPSGQVSSYTEGSVTAYFYSGSKDLIFKGGGTMLDYSSGSSMSWNQYNSQIQSVYMSGTAITYIGSNTFANCTQLTHVALPPVLTGIGANAFSQCSNLLTVTCDATTPPTIDATTFNADAIGNIVLIVPEASANLYKADSYWGKMIIPNADSGNPDTGETAIASGNINDLAWQLFNDGRLIFTGDGDIPNYSSADEQPWANYRDLIYKLHISDKVTGVGSYALAECTELYEIFVQSETLDSIGMYAFANCTNLVQITIASEIVVSADSNAFSGVTTSNITMSMMEEIMESYQDGVWADMQKTPLNTKPEEVSGLIYENLYWSFKSSEGLLTIYGNGAMPDWIQSLKLRLE